MLNLIKTLLADYPDLVVTKRDEEFVVTSQIKSFISNLDDEFCIEVVDDLLSIDPETIKIINSNWDELQDYKALTKAFKKFKAYCIKKLDTEIERLTSIKATIK